MKREKIRWYDLRANWVNGNLADTVADVRKLSAAALGRITLEALSSYRSGQYQTGDLCDLVEILHATFNRK